MFFSNDTRVATNAVPNNFTVGPAEPNVGQYGWTKEDRGHYNQLIQYVEECRAAVETVEAMASYVEELARKLTGITIIYDDVVRIQTALREMEALLTADFTDFKAKYAEFLVKYNNFRVTYEDFLVKYKEVLDAAAAAKSSADSAKASEDKSKASADAAAESAREAAEIVEKGQIYRGTWLATTDVYPPHFDTNSVWDVLLPEGVDSHVFGGFTWKAGDRLLYVKDLTEYQQIKSSITVTSVNGKTGSVTLTAADVDAYTKTEVDTQLNSKVPITRKIQGKELTGDLNFVSGDFNAVSRDGDTMSGPLYISIGGNGASLSTSSSGAEFTNTKTGSSLVIGNDDALSYKGNKVYHEGYKPTYIDVGAAPTGYGLGMGGTSITSIVGDVPLRRHSGFYQGSNIEGIPGAGHQWKYLFSQAHENAAGYFGYLAIDFFGEHAWIGSQVNGGNTGPFELYHTGFKPTPADIGSVAIGNSREDVLADFGVYDGQPRDFNTLPVGFCGLIVNAGSSNVPPWPCSGDGHYHVEMQRVLDNEFVQRTLPFRGSTATAHRVQNAAGQWSDWVLSYSETHKPTHTDVGASIRKDLDPGVDLNSVYGSAWTGFFNVPGNTTNWPYGSSGGSMMVSAHDQYTRQIAFAATAGTIMHRRQTDIGSWTAWSPIYSSEHKPTASEVGAVQKTSLPNYADLQAVRTSGHYRVEDDPVNAPPTFNTDFGQMIHVNGHGDTHLQIFGDYENGHLAFRSFNNSVGDSGPVSWNEIYHTGFKPTPQEIGAISYGKNILNNAGSGVGFISSSDSGAAWVSSYFGTDAGPKVVTGTLNGVPVIGAHAPNLGAWANLFINCYPSESPPFSTVINDPQARNQGDTQNYKIYHQGFKPTVDEVTGLRAEIDELKSWPKMSNPAVADQWDTWVIEHRNGLIEQGGVISIDNAIMGHVRDFLVPFSKVFTVTLTPLLDGDGRWGGAEANNAIITFTNNSFTAVSGHGKTPCRFMWTAKGMK